MSFMSINAVLMSISSFFNVAFVCKASLVHCITFCPAGTTECAVDLQVVGLATMTMTGAHPCGLLFPLKPLTC